MTYYTCELCGQAESSVQEMRKHYRQEHPETYNNSNYIKTRAYISIPFKKQPKPKKEE